MEQSKQCVSRELAERMKKLGFQQESAFYWVQGVLEYEPDGCICIHDTDDWFLSFELPLPVEFEVFGKRLDALLGNPPKNENVGKKEQDELYALVRSKTISAYTVSELGEMIEKSNVSRMGLVRSYLEVMDLDEDILDESVYDHYEAVMCINLMTQPDISAQMLIWLAEQHLIDPSKIKI